MLYNKKTQKKVNITGKHSKKIISGAWNNKNYLAVGSEDRQVAVYYRLNNNDRFLCMMEKVNQ
jgi:WD40 repeat protein